MSRLPLTSPRFPFPLSFLSISSLGAATHRPLILGSSRPRFGPPSVLPKPPGRLSSTMASDRFWQRCRSILHRCDVSDALQKLKIPGGGFLPGITMFSPEHQAGPTKIIGPAYTVQYVPVSDPTPKYPSHYIDSIPKGAVVFLSSPRSANAVFGGLMATRAQASGAVGAVLDGRLRDLDEHRDLGFPVFARGVSTASPNPIAKVVAINVPVQYASDGADVRIEPGDYIVADLNGAVVLPKGLAAQALPLMAKQVAADEQMGKAIKAGMTFTEASKKFRGEDVMDGDM